MAPKLQLENPLPTSSKQPGGKDYTTDSTLYVNNAYDALQSMSVKDRLEALTFLYKKGFGSATKPSGGGLEPEDINRYAAFLIFQNNTTNKSGLKVSPQEAYDSLKSSPDVSHGGTKVTYTSKMDVTSVFQQVAERDLGRKPTQTEIEKFFNAYHGMETKATTKDQAPSVGAAAESQLKTTNTGEVKATGFADYARAFQDMLRGA